MYSSRTQPWLTTNKRDTERVPVPSPLYGEVKVFQPMTILDVSRGGAQIETPFALQLDSLHDFRISLGSAQWWSRGASPIAISGT